MTTITDTSVLHWLPFYNIRAELWKLALIDAENQNWNSTDLSNGTKILEKMAASKHGMIYSLLGSPAQLGLATGLLLSLLINSRIWTAKANREGFGSKLLLRDPKPYQWVLHLTPSSSFTFAHTKTFILHYLYLLPLFAFVLLFPLLILSLIILLPFAAYRFAVSVYLERMPSNRMKRKLFSGADAVWTFNESHESYSVINALILLEGKPDIFKLREIFRDRLGAFPKLRMRRGFTLGYATWYEDQGLDLGSLVQWLPGTWGDTHWDESKEEEHQKENHLTPDKMRRTEEESGGAKGKVFGNKRQSKLAANDDLSSQKWNRKNLCGIVARLCNVPLPEEHTASWEARVGRAMAWECDESEGCDTRVNCDNRQPYMSNVFPILFRIHHSIGDGASLLQLLMSTLIDDESTLATTNDKQSFKGALKNTSYSRSQMLRESSRKRYPINNDPLFNMGTEDCKDYLKHPECSNQKLSQCSNIDEYGKYSEKLNVKHMRSNSETQNPSPMQNKINEEQESSFLYGRRLSGRKIILWDSTSVTVEEIKKIRAATGVKFTEILLSAVSAALASYWEARKNDIINDDLNATNSLSGKRCMGQKEMRCKIDNTKTSDEEREQEFNKLEDFQYLKYSSSDNKLENPPSSVKLVVPAMLGSLFQAPKSIRSNDGNGLENLFSVAVMTLPVGKSGGCPLKRLSQVSDASGCMMPLRKDSIIDYKPKLNLDMLNKKVDNSDLPCPSPIKNESRILGSMESKGFQLPTEYKSCDILKNELKDSRMNTKDLEKTALINLHGSEVLTYYYTTKQAETVLKLNPKAFLTLEKDTTVQYHKTSDSAELIIHNKEPYSCPTTIFFTHNNKRNSDSKCLLKMQEVSGKDACIKEIQNENANFLIFSNSKISANVKSENEAKDESTNNADENHASEMPPSTQGGPTSKTLQSISSLQLPSSPTIQHLLTRWLALDIVATIIPTFLAAPLMSLASKGVAVVLSNLPGPPKRLSSILGGHPMKEIVFWAPHRGYTGLGVTVISYNGRLQIGLMADEAVVPTQEGAEFILNTMLDELHCLGAAVSATHQ